MVKNYGRILIGWDNIFGGRLGDNAVGMVWHNKESGINAVKTGHDLVMALTDNSFHYHCISQSNVMMIKFENLH